MTQPVLSIVIPTRHESSTIAPFIQRLLRAVREVPTEIVVVDDSDYDNTVEVLEQLQIAYGRDRLNVLHRARGSVPDRTLGTAVMCGIRAVRGAYICVMDADGQHPPEVIPRMLTTAVQNHADYVGGSRYMSGGSPEGLNGFGRKATSLGLALLTRLTFVLTPIRSLTDPLSGFFLFRRSLVDGLALHPVGWKISLEILVRSRAQRLVEVPYTFAPRMDGDSKANVRQGLLTLTHIIVLLLSLVDMTLTKIRKDTNCSHTERNEETVSGKYATGSACQIEKRGQNDTGQPDFQQNHGYRPKTLKEFSHNRVQLG